MSAAKTGKKKSKADVQKGLAIGGLGALGAPMILDAMDGGGGGFMGIGGGSDDEEGDGNGVPSAASNNNSVVVNNNINTTAADQMSGGVPHMGQANSSNINALDINRKRYAVGY
ncbi:hypothetical protein SARC_11264 [Sphaeroforma arctica JP610]|uniref:Uncharacterized protein n=1 Tax=Sphaeroforma arctica JP610 TaxID=667725 RepID=A0A0L0FHH5_9EUKA|nr:hypothetical protein SARC_11264 [Sphaeroforma arctica JP610]KNC76224.1 hypothetical protein SARC_11264 [Sphaeroforma arctica JP610]|eukprot:XP_014150126.1 hypothetical protein SARC_11264 [Sphaeroforma arctica JP610]